MQGMSCNARNSSTSFSKRPTPQYPPQCRQQHVLHTPLPLPPPLLRRLARRCLLLAIGLPCFRLQVTLFRRIGKAGLEAVQLGQRLHRQRIDANRSTKDVAAAEPRLL